jgi:hypothetical protein
MSVLVGGQNFGAGLALHGLSKDVIAVMVVEDHHSIPGDQA